MSTDFEKHRRPREPLSGTAFSQIGRDTRQKGMLVDDDPYKSTYQAANNIVTGDNQPRGEKKINGYTGYIPQKPFEFGANFQEVRHRAEGRAEEMAEEKKRFTTTLTGPEDIEAPYRPRGVVAEQSKPTARYPVGYKGFVPGRAWSFGENHHKIMERLEGEAEREKREDEQAAEFTRSRGITPHKTNLGAPVPEVPVYKGVNASLRQAAPRLPETKKMQNIHSKIATHRAILDQRAIPTVTLLPEDEDHFSNPSYLRLTNRPAQPEGAQGHLPGYSGHFRGKLIDDLGSSFGVKTKVALERQRQLSNTN
jgi:hypothetical protein